MKQTLHKVVGHLILTFKELNTVCNEADLTQGSRPSFQELKTVFVEAESNDEQYASPTFGFSFTKWS